MKLSCIAVTLLLCAGATLSQSPTPLPTVEVGSTADPDSTSDQPSGQTPDYTATSDQPSGQTPDYTATSDQPSGQTPDNTATPDQTIITDVPTAATEAPTDTAPGEEVPGGLSPGAIAGITVGTLAGVAGVGGGIFGLLKYTGKI